MGILLTVKGADFSANAIGFAAPVQGGLEFWNYYGDTTAKTARNLVVGKPAVGVVGTPVPGAGFATFQGNVNYVTTGLLDQAEVTLLAVARPAGMVSGSFGYIIGNYNTAAGVGNGGSNLLFGQSNSNPLTPAPSVLSSRTASGASSDAVVYGTVAAEPSLSTFSFFAGRMGAAYNRIDDKTRGLVGAGSTANPRSAPNGLAYRIGYAASGVPNAGGTIDIAFAAIYSRCLTDAEISSIYTRVQAYLANKSITV